MTYIKQEFPKWIYASGGRAKVVHSPEEHHAHGDGWYESPAFIPAEAVASAQQADIQRRFSEPVAAIAEDSAEKLKKFYAAPAKVVVDNVVGLDSEDDLRELRDIEENRPGGPRRTVLKAVADRLSMMAASPAQKM